MDYVPNLEQAANRHYQDACLLMSAKRFDNAGYHFGWAAECAIKQSLRTYGVGEKDEAIWKHLPELKSLAVIALQSVSGRRSTPLRDLLERANFMQWWDIKMRYARNGSVEEQRAARWRDDADEAIGILYE